MGGTCPKAASPQSKAGASREEIKTVTKGDPWRLIKVFPLPRFSSRDNTFLHVARKLPRLNTDFCGSQFGGFFANIVPRAKSLVRGGDLFLLQVYLSSRYFTICHKL